VKDIDINWYPSEDTVKEQLYLALDIHMKELPEKEEV
jgi:hypothetical protein